MKTRGRPKKPPEPVQSTDLIVEVPEHLAKVLDTLKKLQSRLEAEMGAGLAGSRGAGINPAHVRMATQLASASSRLGQEVRAWTKRVKELAGTASLEERLEAVKRFIQDLPEAERHQLLGGI